MKVSKDMKDYTAACMETPFNAVAVKAKGSKIAESDMTDYGLIVSPTITHNMISHPGDLRHLIDSVMAPVYKGVITVRGHGWMDSECFVWTGTKQEFNERWEID